jgi:copper(I)-binding protein
LPKSPSRWRRPAAYRVGALTISDPWARGVSQVAPECGGFFVVTNRGGTADRLVAARSPVADAVEIHAIKVVGPDIKMRPLADGLRIPADSTLTLKPRGYHLLFLGLKVPLAKGASLPVTLVFDKAGSLEIELTIRETGMVGKEILVEEKAHAG